MNERCRICLKYQQDVISLLISKEVLGTDLTIADQINSFCQVDVLQHGSKMICLKCAEKSYTAYKFLQDCIRSTEILLGEFKMLSTPKEFIFRPEFEYAECINSSRESNCNFEQEIEIDVFKPELDQADSNISIEEFNWDQKPEIRPEESQPDRNRQPAVHEEVTEKTVSNTSKNKNIVRAAPILSCEYCPKKYIRRSAYLVHLNKHRESNDTSEQNAVPKRHQSSNHHEILNEGNATLDEQTEPRKDRDDLSIHSQNRTEISQKMANAKHATSETTPKKPEFPSRFRLRVSKNRKSRKTHERTHRWPHACRFCDQVQQTLRESMQHQREAHKSEARFVCDTCGKTFFDDRNLQMHKNAHSGDRSHVCHLCGFAFAWQSNLISHLRIHTGVRKYTCSTCGKAFMQLSSLRDHKDSHNVEKKYTCDLCGAKYFRADCLRKHKRDKHGDQSTIYPCEFCSKQFYVRDQCTRHMRNHMAEPRHICGTCGKCFLRRSTLKVHERVHTKEQPYKCELCEKTFSLAHSMRFHMALHTKKKSSHKEKPPTRAKQEGETATDSGDQNLL